jgi:hypothetical protein
MSQLFGMKSNFMRAPANTPMPQSPGSMNTDPAEGLADFLMDKSKVPIQYRSKLKPYVVQEIKVGKTFKGAHTDSELMMLAKHTCTRDWIKRAFQEHSAKDAEIQEAIEPGFFGGIGVVLGHGFDKSEEQKLKRSPDGTVIGISDPRQAVCDAALKGDERLYGGKKRKTIKKKNQKKHKTLRRRKMRRDMH